MASSFLIARLLPSIGSCLLLKSVGMAIIKKGVVITRVTAMGNMDLSELLSPRGFCYSGALHLVIQKYAAWGSFQANGLTNGYFFTALTLALRTHQAKFAPILCKFSPSR